MPTLHIQLLGDLQLMYDDTRVSGVSAPRLQSLFAYLVLHRQHAAYYRAFAEQGKAELEGSHTACVIRAHGL